MLNSRVSLIAFMFILALWFLGSVVHLPWYVSIPEMVAYGILAMASYESYQQMKGVPMPNGDLIKWINLGMMFFWGMQTLRLAYGVAIHIRAFL